MTATAFLPGLRHAVFAAWAAALLIAAYAVITPAHAQSVEDGYCCVTFGEGCEATTDGYCAGGGGYFFEYGGDDYCSDFCAGDPELCGNGQADEGECGPAGTCLEDCDEYKSCPEYDNADDCWFAAGCYWYESSFFDSFCEGDGYFCGDGYCDTEFDEDEDSCSRDCAARCGDGTEDENEDCDDGNEESGDGCSEYCEVEECGNGEIDYWEECDPNTGNSGDVDVANEPTEDCDEYCMWSYCGDGDKDSWFDDDGWYYEEECDDGGNESGDGCAIDCTLEFCGNGFIDVAGQDGDGEDFYEICDDGNEVSGDGCSEWCEPEWCGNGEADGVDSGGEYAEECDQWDEFGGETEQCDEDCTWAECGDGTWNPTAGEECDEGEENTDDPDGYCRTDCTLAHCGDYVTDALWEDCDDGGMGGEGCSIYCTWEACGNGEVDEYEECDPWDGYEGDGMTEDPEEAMDNSEDCTYYCAWSYCGDGITNEYAGEECDPDTGAEWSWEEADFDSADCNYDCTEVLCGDGYTNEAAGEECDDGYTCADGSDCTYQGYCDDDSACEQRDDDSCSNNCEVNPDAEDLCCIEYDYDAGYYLYDYGVGYTEEECEISEGYFVLTNEAEIDDEDADYYCSYIGVCCDVDEEGYDIAYVSRWEDCFGEYVVAAEADPDGDGEITDAEADEACDVETWYECLEEGDGTQRYTGDDDPEGEVGYVLNGVYVTPDQDDEQCMAVHLRGDCETTSLVQAKIDNVSFFPLSEDCFKVEMQGDNL